MKWSRVVLAAVMVAGAASCSNPTAPRIPQPPTEREPTPDKPGIIAWQGVDSTLGHVLGTVARA